MAPSAVRVPDPVHSSFPLSFVARFPQVFVHEGARQALERRFEQAYPGPVALHISDNISRMITFARRGQQLRVRVHHMFLDAPPGVQDSLVRYVIASDRPASQALGHYIASNHYRIRASEPPTSPLRTKGSVHDLMQIFQAVNQRYFSNTHDALIGWGRKSSCETTPRKSRRIIKLGSYSTVQRLIRIHPVLDHRWVPRYFVEYIVYHEMLHHVMPPYRENGRVVLHPPEFRQREQQFHAYARSMDWEREHIGRLLRA